jgi:hypothetical protein
VTGAGLRRGHRRVGHQVDVGPGDAAGVCGQDDGAVHLGQLRQALRTEGSVEQEATRADVEHVGAVAHHQQPAHPRLEDAIHAGAQNPPGATWARSAQPARGSHRAGYWTPGPREEGSSDADGGPPGLGQAGARLLVQAQRCRGGLRRRPGADPHGSMPSGGSGALRGRWPA